ncbi:MAG: hypothetical protein HQK53_00670 [Oligoflexia bacterium]|nr:hypothetical protein [Oligoflexia bacterium]
MDAEYKYECYEEYVGTKEEVIKKIDLCATCGSRLVLGHLPDYKNLLIQEIARCVECGHVIRKVIYVLS